MREFILMLVEGVMDAIEEFFESLTAPSTKFTLSAFIYSLVFLAWSFVAELTEIPCFVQWQEVLTCNILMLIIVLIDGSVRGSIKSGMSKVKQISERFTYSGDEPEEEEPFEESISEEELEVQEDVE